MLKFEKRFNLFFGAFILFLFFGSPKTLANQIRVGSKAFTESYLLAELFAQHLEETFPNTRIKRNLGMGGTGVLFNSLKANEIDLYPEYTGTIAEAILKKPDLKTVSAIKSSLKSRGLIMSEPLGFNNTYALAMRKKHSKQLGIKTISDLKSHPDIKVGFSYEFMERSDGFQALKKHYKLYFSSVRGMEHSLAYPAIESGAIDLMVVYSTDAKIKKLDLRLLKDDKNFFPQYEAVILAQQSFVEQKPFVWESLTKKFVGNLKQSKMIELNALVDLEGKNFKQAVQLFKGSEIQRESDIKIFGFRLTDLWLRLKEHLYLVLLSVSLSILIGLPLGVLAFRIPQIAQIILGVSGVIQTIPSLALLCFFIPVFGIGVTPALFALFLYALLPIVRGTYDGLSSLDPELREVSHIIGLSPRQRLNWIELPLASKSILSGIKTSSIINIGTTTLAAFIGAGGLGSFIVTGLALNNIPLILFGAIPSAILALVFQGLFAIADLFLVPQGLRARDRA